MAAGPVSIRHTLVGGEIYWAVADVALFLRRAGDVWTHSEGVDEVQRAIGAYVHQIAVDLDAEALQRIEWWASYRPGVPMRPAPESILAGGARVRTAVIPRGLGERHLYASSLDLSAFLRAEAARARREFDRESAARMVGRYLMDTADQFEVEAMFALDARQQPQGHMY